MMDEMDLPALIADLQKFLEDFPDKKLSSSQSATKKKLLERCRNVTAASPPAAAMGDTDNCSNGSAESSSKNGSLKAENIGETTPQLPSDENVQPMAAENVKKLSPLHGVLSMRNRKKKSLMSSSKPCFCAIYHGLLYIYKKETDKSQERVIKLLGSKCTECPKDTVEKKKVFVFDLETTDNEVYRFDVSSADLRSAWINTITTSSSPESMQSESTMNDTGEGEDIYELEDTFVRELLPSAHATVQDTGDMDETYADTADTAVDDKKPEEEEELYDEVGKHPPPDLPPRTTDVPAEDSQEIYDDAESAPAASKKFPDPPARTPVTVMSCHVPTPGNDSDQEIYDDGTSVSTAVPQPANAERHVNGSAPQPPGENYDMMFYCVWDCKGGSADEITFKRGEVVEVLEKRYDKEGWWVGKIQTRIGLVPKNFLSPVYKEI